MQEKADSGRALVLARQPQIPARIWAMGRSTWAPCLGCEARGGQGPVGGRPLMRGACIRLSHMMPAPRTQTTPRCFSTPYFPGSETEGRFAAFTTYWILQRILLCLHVRCAQHR